MARELSAPRFDYPALQSLTTPQERLIVCCLMPCRNSPTPERWMRHVVSRGAHVVVLRPSDAKSEHWFNALLHRLTRKLEPVRPGNAVNEPAGP